MPFSTLLLGVVLALVGAFGATCATGEAAFKTARDTSFGYWVGLGILLGIAATFSQTRTIANAFMVLFVVGLLLRDGGQNSTSLNEAAKDLFQEGEAEA